MNLFETVKSAVTVKQAAEYYGWKGIGKRAGGRGALWAGRGTVGYDALHLPR